MEDQRTGFSTLDVLCGLAQRPFETDTGILVFIYDTKYNFLNHEVCENMQELSCAMFF